MTKREYLCDYYGTAMMSGLWSGRFGEIETLDGYGLCELADNLGVDLCQFVVS